MYIAHGRRSAVALLLSYNLGAQSQLAAPVGLADALLAEAAVVCVHRAAEGLEVCARDCRCVRACV
jgi:hypothetical protein